jgi:hypothetical protein
MLHRLVYINISTYKKLCDADFSVTYRYIILLFICLGSRKLYGGDLESAVAVMRTVASRIQFLLQQGPASFYKKEAYIKVRKNC